MSSQRCFAAVGTIFCVALCAALAHAADPDPRDTRQVNPLRRVEMPFEDIRFDDDFRITEGPRSLRDAFPYLAGTHGTTSSTNAWSITPANVGFFLTRKPQEGGTVPAAIRTGAGAIEAVRLFVSGPLVRSKQIADRIVATAHELKNELEHLAIRITDHAPESYTPSAAPLDQDESQHPVEAWAVSLVALEVDHYLRLVHVEATVKADGTVTLERKPIVDGPMTSWQTEMAMGEDQSEAKRIQAEMVAEADRALKTYAEALGAARDLDTFWVLGRVFSRAEDVACFVGKPDLEDEGGMRHGFALEDGTHVYFIARRGKPTQVVHGTRSEKDGAERVKKLLQIRR